jgi:hypothetical protein
MLKLIKSRSLLSKSKSIAFKTIWNCKVSYGSGPGQVLDKNGTLTSGNLSNHLNWSKDGFKILKKSIDVTKTRNIQFFLLLDALMFCKCIHTNCLNNNQN